jgi:hypothetical protein
LNRNKLPKPAKHIFEEFIYKEISFDCFPVQKSNQKKTASISFNEDVIAILNYIYYRMWQNRLNKKNNNQEVVKVSYSIIAKFSRVNKTTVERLVPYIIEIKLLHLISGGGKTKKAGTYCPGEKIYELYSQFYSHS